MIRPFFFVCSCVIVFTLSALSQTSTAPKTAAPRCVREACSAALKGYKGALLNGCHASYVQLSDKSTEAWLVSFDADASKVYRAVDAKTGEVLPNVDPAKVTKCGPRPFNCPAWVYKPCPE